MNRILSLLILLCLSFAACTFTQKIRDGETAYERKQFSVAITMLSKEYKKAKTKVQKGQIAFMLAESYRRTNQNEKAIDWYYNAYNYQYGVDALKEYAYALKRNEQYKEAENAFKELGIEIGSPYEYRREITACKQAADWKSKKEDTGFKVFPAAFSSSSAEYAPSIYADQYLLITSDRNQAQGDDTYAWTGGKFSDLFLVDIKTNTISAFDQIINTANNEGTAVTNQTQTEIIFTRCYSDDKYGDSFCKLMTSTKEGESWSTPKVLSFIDDGVNYGHPALSADGQTLYFSCNHPDGWGGYDIYSSERLQDGWDEPQLLSRTINTIGNEEFPTIDGDTLYFSSDFHTGMGGLDIFKTYWNPKREEWSPIQNLRPPVNSGGDDFAYVVDYRAENDEDVIQKGYFTSSRDGGSGNDDIYRFERRPPPPPPPVQDTIEPEPIVYEMLLDVYVLEKIYTDPDDPNSKILGRRPLNGASLEMTLNGKKESFETKGDQAIRIHLDEASDYYFFATEEGYLNNDAKFSSKGISKDPNNPKKVFEVEIVLDKIFKDKEIVLENIYYDFNEDFIREDAKPTLNALVKTLKQNPGISIQLSSHTDCRGGNTYNENLSQRRAQSAVNYLIQEGGISPDRLIAKGYGENEPSVDCICAQCTEAEHQQNRRTTFKIVEQ
jgi:peptidoglycan-associated lipoprotein